MWLRSLPVLLILSISGCSMHREVDPAWAQQVTPAQISAATRPPPARLQLVWGGSVQSVRNLRDRTRIEILALPLDRQRRPMLDGPASGRFIFEMPGFVEPAELPVGRLVTVIGDYAGKVGVRAQGRVRQLPRLKGERLRVWPASDVHAPRPRPDVHWGIGIGTEGSSVGVNIGL